MTYEESLRITEGSNTQARSQSFGPPPVLRTGFAGCLVQEVCDGAAEATKVSARRSAEKRNPNVQERGSERGMSVLVAGKEVVGEERRAAQPPKAFMRWLFNERTADPLTSVPNSPALAKRLAGRADLEGMPHQTERLERDLDARQ
jgi:hypothetical protein